MSCLRFDENACFPPSGEYLYNRGFGFQGAARDPLAHAFPFTFSEDRHLYKEVRCLVGKESWPTPAVVTCILARLQSCYPAHTPGAQIHNERVSAMPKRQPMHHGAGWSHLSRK